MRAMYFGVDTSIHNQHLATEPDGRPFVGIVALCGMSASNEGLVDLDVKHPPRYSGESGSSVAPGPWCPGCIERANWR